MFFIGMFSGHFNGKLSSDNDDGRGSRSPSAERAIRASRLPFSVEALMSKKDARSESTCPETIRKTCIINQDDRSVDFSEHCVCVKEESASWINKPGLSTPPRKYPYHCLLLKNCFNNHVFNINI